MSEANKISFFIPAEVTVVREHHFAYASIRLRSDGITQINSLDDKLYSLTETKEVHSMVTLLNEDNPILILHMAGMHTSADDESRKFLASEAGLKNRVAFAFVLQSLPQRIVANFYIKMNRPAKPTHFFTSQKEAEKWLLVMKNYKRICE